MNSKNRLKQAVGMCVLLSLPLNCAAAEYTEIAPIYDGSATVEKSAYTIAVQMENDISSLAAQPGDEISAKLVDECDVGSLHLDSTCTLKGHVDNIVAPRSGWRALRQKERRFKKSGSFLLVFDTLVTGDGKTIAVDARILPQKALRIATPEQESKAGWRELKAAKDGTIVTASDSFSPTKRRTINTVSIISSVATMPFGLVPGLVVDAVTSGVIGATTTAIPQSEEMDSSEGSKFQGFVNGAVGSLPPVKIMRFVASPGQDTALKKGDKLKVELCF